MNRRNFLKMLPVGLLAAKFGGLMSILKLNSAPAYIEITLTVNGKRHKSKMLTYQDAEKNWRGVFNTTVTFY
jgi:hypothetical protein